MAENIYSKGTRVWFEDKEQAWLSAEVTQVTKGTDDSIKLVFVDERGKVGLGMNEPEQCLSESQYHRKLPLIPQGRISRVAKRVYHHCATRLY
jgi:hypothetical protein